MTDEAEAARIRARAMYIVAARERALHSLSNDGPYTAVAVLLEQLRVHPELQSKARLFALELLNARQVVVPQGAGAVRQWIEEYPWPL